MAVFTFHTSLFTLVILSPMCILPILKSWKERNFFDKIIERFGSRLVIFFRAIYTRRVEIYYGIWWLNLYCANIQPKLKKLWSSTKNQLFLMASGGLLNFLQYWLNFSSTDLSVKYLCGFFDTPGTPVSVQPSPGWNQPRNS